MNVQLSCLIVLALLGASMVQFVDAAPCPGDTRTCQNGSGVKMCRKKNGQKVTNCIINKKDQRAVLENGGSCGVCGNTNSMDDGNSNNIVRCSASTNADMCVNDNGDRGYYMCSGSKTVCVVDGLTIGLQAIGDQCGCCRGVCPSACPASFDCTKGDGTDGSFMCLKKSNNGATKICVDKRKVKTKQDLGIGTCGLC